MKEWKLIKERILEVQDQLKTWTEGRDSRKYKYAHSQLTIRHDRCRLLQGRNTGQIKEDCQKMMAEIDILYVEIEAKSALSDILSFMKSIDQFRRACENCRSENESQQKEYKRLVVIIKDNFDLIVAIKKQKDLEIPPDVITAENHLLHCLKILHKSALNNVLLFLKDIDQLQKECDNCCRSENEVHRSKYIRLVEVISDKLNVINDIKKQNDLEIPPEVLAGRKCLLHCFYLLHKRME